MVWVKSQSHLENRSPGEVKSQMRQWISNRRPGRTLSSQIPPPPRSWIRGGERFDAAFALVQGASTRVGLHHAGVGGVEGHLGFIEEYRDLA
jgi:hypothetical protein